MEVSRSILKLHILVFPGRNAENTINGIVNVQQSTVYLNKMPNVMLSSLWCLYKKYEDAVVRRTRRHKQQFPDIPTLLQSIKYVLLFFCIPNSFLGWKSGQSSAIRIQRFYKPERTLTLPCFWLELKISDAPSVSSFPSFPQGVKWADFQLAFHVFGYVMREN